MGDFASIAGGEARGRLLSGAYINGHRVEGIEPLLGFTSGSDSMKGVRR
jgi:hypothetical protein